MSHTLAALTFPSDRTLLARTKLAYVHLPRLLSHAKRDRSARVSGYVAIWLPECLVVLYLKSGELVNASFDTGKERGAVAISEALSRIPAEPEWGAIAFHEAAEEQLACMYASHTAPEIVLEGGSASDTGEFWERMAGGSFSGTVELTLDNHVNYLICEDGKVVRGYLSGSSERPLAERAARALAGSGGTGQTVRCYRMAPSLPVQAAPALIAAYRDLIQALVQRLVADGRESAAAIAEHARGNLVSRHVTLAAFGSAEAGRGDPVCTPRELSRDIAAWVTETIWAGMDIESGDPGGIIREVAHERRHMFQSAGFFDHIPWKVEW